MDQRFVGYYEEELRYLRDLGGEFAKDNPRIARHLGLDGSSCEDPYVERLLEGVAFLAARVRLRQDTSFHRFTNHLLEMVYPGYLAPTPAALIVQLEPDQRAGSLQAGSTVPHGTRLHAAITPSQTTRCIFTTCHDVTLWPIRLSDVAYLTGAALKTRPLPTAATGQGTVHAALKLVVETTNGARFADLSLDDLVLHIQGDDQIAFSLYEALIGAGMGLAVYDGMSAGHALHAAGADAIVRVGFADDEALFPVSKRSFKGYRLLAEYFAFPRRYMFVRLRDLAKGIAKLSADRLEILIPLDRIDAGLERTVTKNEMALFATPAINLFPRSARASIQPGETAHRVVVDPKRELDFEVYDLETVTGYSSDYDAPLAFEPFYRRRAFASEPHGYYTIERRARPPSSADGRSKKRPQRSEYRGGEVFVTLVDRRERALEQEIDRLEIQALCTNRDLPADPIFDNGRDRFTHETGHPIGHIHVLGKVSPPRPSTAYGASPKLGLPTTDHRDLPWRLVSHLTPNYLSLADPADEHRDAGEGATTLRELLRLYADTATPSLARQIEGVRSITTRPIIERLPGRGPITFGRGGRDQRHLGRCRIQGSERLSARRRARTVFSSLRIDQRLHPLRRAQPGTWGDQAMGRPGLATETRSRLRQSAGSRSCCVRLLRGASAARACP